MELLFDVILRHLPLLKMNHGALDLDPDIDDLAGRGALIADMRTEGFSDWADRLGDRQVRVRLRDSASDAAIDLLMGRAAGLYYAKNIDQATIPVIDNILLAFPDGWRDFGEAASRNIEADLNRSKELLRITSEMVISFEEDMARENVLAHRRHAKELIKSFKSTPLLRNVWHELPHDAIIGTDNALFFDVLRRCNPVEFIKLIDAFCHPQVGRDILHFVDRIGLFEDMLELLKLTPPAFDTEGNWHKNIKTPVLVLQAIGRKLAHIAITDDPSDVGNSAEQPSEAFRTAVESIFGILKARIDSEQIGFSWLENLVDLGEFEFRPRSAQDERLGVCYRFLISEVAKSLSPHPFATTWIEAQEVHWRYNRAITVIAVAALGNGGGTALVSELVKATLHQEVLSTASTGQFIGAGFTSQRFLVGLSLASIQDISSFFVNLWKSLSQLRDRSRHLESSRYERAGVADELLTSWFLCAAESIGPDHIEARSLWLALFDVIRETALTQRALSEDHLAIQYKFLAGLLAIRLRRPEDDLARQDLTKLLSLFVWPDPQLPRILIMLRDMGTPASVIRAAIPDLPRVFDLLKKFVSDQVEMQRRFKAARLNPNESLSKKVEAIIAELDGRNTP
jgi:hypothetical protein